VAEESGKEGGDNYGSRPNYQDYELEGKRRDEKGEEVIGGWF
jgi:hypothetical protein